VADYNLVFQNGTNAKNSGLVLFTSSFPFELPAQEDSTNVLSFSFYSITPILGNGWAILGETSKLVTTSAQRIQSISTNNSGVSVQLIGAPNEKVEFAFVAPSGDIVLQATTLSPQGTGSISSL